MQTVCFVSQVCVKCCREYMCINVVPYPKTSLCFLMPPLPPGACTLDAKQNCNVVSNTDGQLDGNNTRHGIHNYSQCCVACCHMKKLAIQGPFYCLRLWPSDSCQPAPPPCPPPGCWDRPRAGPARSLWRFRERNRSRLHTLVASWTQLVTK